MVNLCYVWHHSKKTKQKPSTSLLGIMMNKKLYLFLLTNYHQMSNKYYWPLNKKPNLWHPNVLILTIIFFCISTRNSSVWHREILTFYFIYTALKTDIYYICKKKWPTKIKANNSSLYLIFKNHKEEEKCINCPVRKEFTILRT